MQFSSKLADHAAVCSNWNPIPMNPVASRRFSGNFHEMTMSEIEVKLTQTLLTLLLRLLFLPPFYGAFDTCSSFEQFFLAEAFLFQAEQFCSDQAILILVEQFFLAKAAKQLATGKYFSY